MPETIYHGPSRSVTVDSTDIGDVAHLQCNWEAKVFAGHESDHPVGGDGTLEIDAVDGSQLSTLEALIGTEVTVTWQDPAGNTFTVADVVLNVGYSGNFDNAEEPNSITLRARKYTDKPSDFFSIAAAA